MSVLKLDELIAEPDLLARRRERIFVPLSLDVPQKVVNRLEKPNAERKVSTAPEISADDRKAIASYPGIAIPMDTMFASR